MVNGRDAILPPVGGPHAKRDERCNLQMLANVACHMTTNMLRFFRAKTRLAETKTCFGISNYFIKRALARKSG